MSQSECWVDPEKRGNMDLRVMWALVIAALMVVGLVTWMVMRRYRTARLRKRFGNEYDRTVQATGDVRRAEADLVERASRVEALNIRPLNRDDQVRFAAAW